MRSSRDEHLGSYVLQPKLIDFYAHRALEEWFYGRTGTYSTNLPSLIRVDLLDSIDFAVFVNGEQ